MADGNKRTMPKGVRKGGTRFPRQSLVEVLPWAKKLVVKTHLSPQPQDVVLSGVVGNSGSKGEVRLSSLKQFGLMEGDSKAYFASALAKRIDAAPPEEIGTFLRDSSLMPAVFKSLFDTFQGDEVSIAKLRQRASELKVHPEETAKCVENYVASFALAKLVKTEGEKVVHIAASSLATKAELLPQPTEEGDEISTDQEVAIPEKTEDEVEDQQETAAVADKRTGKAAFNITVNIDSSFDSDKLEKQLKLLKRYGVI